MKGATLGAALGSAHASNAGLRHAWWWCGREENIDSRRPSRLPLLFALDGKLGIADGFTYVPDCGPLRRRRDERGAATHCGTDFGAPSIDGVLDGFGDGEDAGESSVSDAAAIGDGGCGGGCGGGSGGD